MNKLFAILILSFFFNFLSAQKNIDPKAMVGFACYSGGTPSETVQKLTKLMYKEKYKKLIKLIDSENSAEKFLACVTLQKLEEKNKIKLNETERRKLEFIKKSNELVSVCSGCTYFQKIPIQKLFEESEENYIKIYVNDWLTKFNL